MSRKSVTKEGAGGWNAETARRGRRFGAAWRASSAGLAASLLAGGSAGAAAPVGVRLAYQRAPGVELCPDEELLREEITRQLGYDPVDTEAKAQLRAMIFRGPDREVHATMELTNAAGAVTWTRHLVAYNDDCTELVLNMALSIRVALDPRLQPQAPRPEEPPRQEPPATPPESLPPTRRDPPIAPFPPPVAPPIVDARPRAAGRGAPGPELRAGLGGGLSFGTLPAASGGPSLEGSLRFHRVSLGLEGRVDLPTTIDFTPEIRITAWLAAATLVTCARSGYAFGTIFGCGFVSVGVLASAGTGLKLTNDPLSPVAAAGPRAGVELPITDRLAAQIHGDLALRMSRTDLFVEGRKAWTSPAFAGLIGVGVVLTFSRPSAPAMPGRAAP